MEYEAIVGIDEVGRGALAGPVVVGAVYLPEAKKESFLTELLMKTSLKKLRDSKKLSLRQRERVVEFVQDKILWSVGEIQPDQIDTLGITEAIRRAAGQAISRLQEQRLIEFISADASLHHPFEATINTKWTIKGDETVPAISLASILAKVYRDRLMQNYDLEYPGYGFAKHVGYGTVGHYKAIKEQGITPLHRKLFLRSLK